MSYSGEDNGEVGGDTVLESLPLLDTTAQVMQIDWKVTDVRIAESPGTTNTS